MVSHDHNQLIVLNISLVKLIQCIFATENYSPEMAESGLINNALSEGVDVNPPVHEFNLFGTHNQTRAVAIDIAA